MSRSFRRYGVRPVSERGLTEPEYNVLRAVADAGGSRKFPLTMGRMTPERKAAGALRTVVVERLVNEGLLEWVRCAAHGPAYERLPGEMLYPSRLYTTALAAKAMYVYEGEQMLKAG